MQVISRLPIVDDERDRERGDDRHYHYENDASAIVLQDIGRRGPGGRRRGILGPLSSWITCDAKVLDGHTRKPPRDIRTVERTATKTNGQTSAVSDLHSILLSHEREPLGVLIRWPDFLSSNQRFFSAAIRTNG